jgi:PKD repeat protein
VSLSAAVTLTGTVADDGLPTPSAVTQLWTEISGPGTVTFAGATSAATTATFSVAGTYVLRLTASDGALSAFDEVTVTVTAAPPTNVAPAVNAGPNRNVALSASASLDGTVTDDGLPTPSTVTQLWTEVSGPGDVTFAGATLVDTTATFSMAGTYVLRLTASDGALSAFDEVTVTVTASSTNVAPTVNAGPNQNVTLPASVSLDGTVTDDGLPTPSTVTQLWTEVSGPGDVTFASATSVDTSATFSMAGTYVLRLTASDGALSGQDEMTVTVMPLAKPGAPSVMNENTASPTLSGTGPVGATITILEGTSVLGTTTVGTDGTWTYTLTGLTTGTHAISTTVTVGSNTSAQSNPINVVVDASKPVSGGAPAASDDGKKKCGVGSVSAMVLLSLLVLNILGLCQRRKLGGDV